MEAATVRIFTHWTQGVQFALPLTPLQPGWIPGKVGGRGPRLRGWGARRASLAKGLPLPPLQGRWRSPLLHAQWLWLLRAPLPGLRGGPSVSRVLTALASLLPLLLVS